MPDLRQDALLKRWVVIAEERAARPIEFPHGLRAAITADGRCPFCLGHEEDTPDEIYRIPRDSADWSVRIVPNKFPAVSNCDQPTTENGFFQRRVAHGAHEVIIESPQHVVSPSQLSDEHFQLVCQAYRDRLRTLGVAFPYVQLFKNVGASGGASIEHIHSQVLALAHPPDGVVARRNAFRDYYGNHHRCGLCEMLDQELSNGARVLSKTERLVAFCPFASRLPYETWIAPRQHSARFEDIGDDLLSEMAVLVKSVLCQFDDHLNRPAFNYLLHSAPFDSNSQDHYHWHMEIFPRMTTKAGFEWASGCFVNPVSPESAAARLRS